MNERCEMEAARNSMIVPVLFSRKTASCPFKVVGSAFQINTTAALSSRRVNEVVVQMMDVERGPKSIASLAFRKGKNKTIGKVL